MNPDLALKMHRQLRNYNSFPYIIVENNFEIVVTLIESLLRILNPNYALEIFRRHL